MTAPVLAKLIRLERHARFHVVDEEGGLIFTWEFDGKAYEEAVKGELEESTPAAEESTPAAEESTPAPEESTPAPEKARPRRRRARLRRRKARPRRRRVRPRRRIRASRILREALTTGCWRTP